MQASTDERQARVLAAAPGESVVALGVVALARAFACGDASPRQACDVYLDRILRHDGAIGAFVAVDGDRARHDAAASARRWTRRESRSPIDGVPVAIKANIAVRGLPWTAGIYAWRDRIATEDAACVARLREAGAVILGTVNMDAGALGASTDNPWYGRTHNPYDRDRSAGGSSGGAAAAVAARLCAAALGTDTMGSVRIPAAACGLFAIVPPVEALDRRGVLPLAPSFDRLGILARSLPDLEAMLDALAPSSRRRDDEAPLALLSIDRQTSVDASIRAAYDRLRKGIAAAGRTTAVDLHECDVDRVAHQLLLLVEVEGAAIYRHQLADPADPLGAELTSLLRHGAGLPTARRAEAARHLAAADASIRAALRGNAGLASPTVPHPAALFDAPAPRNTACFTALASITDLPAIVLPFADDEGGLPQSLQLLADTSEAAFGLARRLQAYLEAVPPPSEAAWIAPASLG